MYYFSQMYYKLLINTQHIQPVYYVLLISWCIYKELILIFIKQS